MFANKQDRLTAELYLPLLPSKPNLPVSLPALLLNTCCGSPLPQFLSPAEHLFWSFLILCLNSQQTRQILVEHPVFLPPSATNFYPISISKCLLTKLRKKKKKKGLSETSSDHTWQDVRTVSYQTTHRHHTLLREGNGQQKTS